MQCLRMQDVAAVAIHQGTCRSHITHLMVCIVLHMRLLRKLDIKRALIPRQGRQGLVEAAVVLPIHAFELNRAELPRQVRRGVDDVRMQDVATVEGLER